MKKYSILLLLIFLVTPLMAQSGWTVIKQDTNLTMKALHFTSADTGYIIGDSSHPGKSYSTSFAWRTVDGGASWKQMTMPPGIIPRWASWTTMSFPTSSVGYLGGSIYDPYPATNSSLFLRTTNGGDSWKQIPFDSNSFPEELDFPTPVVGYVVMYSAIGMNTLISKSIDSGKSWKSTGIVSSPDSGGFIIRFRDEVHGMLKEDRNTEPGSMRLLVTSDGLQTWKQTQVCNGCDLFNSVTPISDRGWVVGINSDIYRTSDDGGTWSNVLHYPSYDFITGFAFHGSSGYALLPTYPSAALATYSIWKSTDSGLTWGEQMLPGAPLRLRYVSAPTDSVAYVAAYDTNSGYYPVILKTTDGGGPTISSVVSPNFTPNLLLLSSYPDPITSRTTISFKLPEASEVRLWVADAAGRETPILQSTWLAAGRHEAAWDASKYPSGVYLCRIESGGQSATRRVVVKH